MKRKVDKWSLGKHNTDHHNTDTNPVNYAVKFRFKTKEDKPETHAGQYVGSYEISATDEANALDIAKFKLENFVHYFPNSFELIEVIPIEDWNGVGRPPIWAAKSHMTR